MARALLLVALAAGAAAFPQRLRASASPAKKAAHDHPRRAAPSLGSDFVENEDSLDDAKAAYVAARTELGKAMTQAVVEASTDADIKDADGNPMTPEDFVKEAKAAACQFKGSC